jgi:hypothetical protein
MLVLMAVQVGGELIVVYPSAPTEGPTLDDDGDGKDWVAAVVEEAEIALLLSELVDVADEDKDVEPVDDIVANNDDDADGDVDDVDNNVEKDDDANKEDEDETVEEDIVDAREEDDDLEATPMYLAPRIPPLLTAPPRVFFK